MELCDFKPPEDPTADKVLGCDPCGREVGSDPEEFEREYNNTIVELHSSLKLLDEWMDFAVTVTSKELHELLGTAYGEFLNLKHRTFKHLSEWDLSNLDTADQEVIDGVVVD